MFNLKWAAFLLVALTTGCFVFFAYKARVTGPAESVHFSAAKNTLTKSCASCHATFGTMSEQEWLASKYLIAGAPERSPLYRSLRVAGGKMPPVGDFSEAEAKVLHTWIGSLSQTGQSGLRHESHAEPELRFSRARTIIQNRCASCHSIEVQASSAYRQGQTVPAFALFQKENDFVLSGLVSPQWNEHSWISLALKNRTVHRSVRGSFEALSTQEESQWQQWIDEMGRRN